jgi:3'-phosphoadenosine 5'-phosphosulfate sulfotransferase (PAPS reductase)/FAD synthetase
VRAKPARHLADRLPYHAWTVEQVWQRIRASGVRHHPAYDLGMPRLSCCFCIFAPRSALLLAGKHNPELLAEYVRVERAIGHRFRQELPLADVQRALEEGEEPGPVQNWAM